MRKIITILILICGISLTGFAQEVHRTEIPLLAGERWWGMTPEGDVWEQMNESRGYEFKTRMMVSSAGRYLWSDELIAIRSAEGMMTVESGHEKVEVQKSGKTLREAYLTCVHKNIAQGRQMPDTELFTRPVYRPGNNYGITWGQDEIMDYARRIVSEELPVGTIVIPEGWCSANVAFAFQPELFPDPKGMIEQLHGMGFKVMLTVTPRIPTIGRVKTDAGRDGYFYTWSVDGYTTLDIRNERFFTSFREGFKKLMGEYAFDGYRLEYRLPQTRTLFLNFGDPFRLNWEKLAGDVTRMCEITGTYMRDFPSYVTDIDPQWFVRPEHIFQILFSASLSGDMYKTAGYVPSNSEEIKAPHTIASLFFPVASVNYAPWEFKERKLYEQVKSALLFRASLAGYMENLVKESAKTGEPIARHMEYQFPRQGFSDCDDQFMLGPKYLIAFCTDGAAKRMVRLPKGRWTDRNGKTFKGPLVTEAECAAGLIYFELAK